MGLFLDHQKAIVALLRADSALTATVPAARIAEVLDDTVAFPRIWVEDGGCQDWSTKTDSGVMSEVVLHVGSRTNNTVQLRSIGEHLHRLLHEANLVLDAGQCVLCRFDRYVVVLEQDGITRHGVFRFQLSNSQGV